MGSSSASKRISGGTGLMQEHGSHIWVAGLNKPETLNPALRAQVPDKCLCGERD